MLEQLEQGPYPIDSDDGWRMLRTTSPSDRYVRNPGMGLIGYTWEENGPSLPVREGAESIERFVDKICSSPYVDALYIRCDWRDVQRVPGKLELSPVWELTLDAAKRRGIPVGFRVQLSSPNVQPGRLAVPDFVRERVPYVNIGRKPGGAFDYYEPRYDHSAFQSAFRELNGLLADRFDDDPVIAFMDLMMYGFWGEGHTSGLPHPFPDDSTAARTMTGMALEQMETWKRVPLVVNAQTDISRVGNAAIQDLAMAAGHWIRVDSIIVEEPWGIDRIASRPPGIGLIVEDGPYRHYDDARIPRRATGISAMEDAMRHVSDVGGHYWALWTEVDRFEAFAEANPQAFPALRRRIGYRLRPAWIWQRIKGDADELIVAVANDGCAGVPGKLRIVLESAGGQYTAAGFLAAGEPAGGRIRLASFLLPPGLACREVRLRAELELREGVARSVQWCCADETNPDGSLSIALCGHEEEGWRKNV